MFMTSRTVRVTVRGFFDQLSDAQMAELVEAGAAHSFLNTAYTAEGYLAYDLPGRPGFAFRFAEQAEQEKDIAQAVVRAEAKARAWMRERGYAVKNLSSQAVDMSEVPLGKRGRREAERRA
jgi:ABC-type nitrate/sulfonate/bicarbonate transport system substrate-binding protein